MSDIRLHEYQEILSGEFPDFLNKYLSLKILTRLKGVGLLCGTDWTPLFKNKFFYSRFDHSLNCALIVWKWTHDKRQTIASLLHDVSTPVFSHVIDFKNGDALSQSSTENLNAKMISCDKELNFAIKKDGFIANDINDYHKFSICDNEVPQLSADRLEYMFPSGAALQGIFSLRSIRRIYNDLSLSVDEQGLTEFSFKTKKIAFEYFKRCLKVGMILQRNEDKIAMELLAQVVDKAIKCGALTELELYSLSEKEIICRWDKMLGAASSNKKASKPYGTENQTDFLRHYKTFRTMKKIKRSDFPLPNHFCVSLEVKRRYINPLFKKERICSISKKAETLRQKFLNYQDTKFGCVPLSEL